MKTLQLTVSITFYNTDDEGMATDAPLDTRALGQIAREAVGREMGNGAFTSGFDNVYIDRWGVEAVWIDTPEAP